MFATNIDVSKLSEEEKQKMLEDSGQVEPDEPSDKEEEAEEEEEKEPVKKEPIKKPEKKTEPEEEEEAEDNSEDEEEDDEEAEAPHRPERYIPVPKYQSEKKQWKEERQALTDRITALESGARETDPGSKDESALVEDFSKKYPDADKEQVLEIVRLARAGMEIPADVKKDLALTTSYVRNIKEREFYDNEFKGVLSLIKAKFPDADEAQISEIKQRLDVLSHTKELCKTPLKYIFSAHAEEFEPKEEEEKVVGKKTVERSRGTGNRTTPAKTAKDFKDATDFSEILAMTDEDRDNIIAGMDTNTWNRYVQWTGDQGDGETINRGGRKVKLK